MRITATLALILALSSSAIAAPRKHHAKADTAWIRACIHERTGPDGGVSVHEARAICRLEQPDDEVAAAKSQLRLAKAHAKLTKARARTAKAIEACEQAIVDACVEAALPDGSTDCEDAALRPAFAQCH